MISHNRIKKHADEWGVGEQIIEKDYCLGWLLKAIGAHTEINKSWIFKGGTCLKKCYLETYRFSEDLDFTVTDASLIEPQKLLRIISELEAYLRGETGMDFKAAEPKISHGKNPLFAGVKLYFRGPRNAPNPAAIKLDLSASEKMAAEPVLRKVYHPYGEPEYGTVSVQAYSMEELFAEKIRAMSERCMPRDLYDIINLFRRTDFNNNPKVIKELLVKKCGSKGVPVPDFAYINNLPDRAELENSWEHMLGHQLPALPDLKGFWDELPLLFDWLEGRYVIPDRGSISDIEADELKEEPARYGEPMRFDSTVEAIRYAAVNRLLINLGYDNSKRLIEPYSLRRTKDGNLILHAIKPGVGHRKYRINRIQSVEITTQRFVPAYNVEFPLTGELPKDD